MKGSDFRKAISGVLFEPIEHAMERLRRSHPNVRWDISEGNRHEVRVRAQHDGNEHSAEIRPAR